MASGSSTPLEEAAQLAFDDLNEALEESASLAKASNQKTEAGAEKVFDAVVLKAQSIIAEA